MALHTLPEDCIHAVLRNCSLCAIGRTGRACTALREAAAAQSLWEELNNERWAEQAAVLTGVTEQRQRYKLLQKWSPALGLWVLADAYPYGMLVAAQLVKPGLITFDLLRFRSVPRHATPRPASAGVTRQRSEHFGPITPARTRIAQVCLHDIGGAQPEAAFALGHGYYDPGAPAGPPMLAAIVRMHESPHEQAEAVLSLQMHKRQLAQAPLVGLRRACTAAQLTIEVPYNQLTQLYAHMAEDDAVGRLQNAVFGHVEYDADEAGHIILTHPYAYRDSVGDVHLSALPEQQHSEQAGTRLTAEPQESQQQPAGAGHHALWAMVLRLFQEHHPAGVPMLSPPSPPPPPTATATTTPKEMQGGGGGTAATGGDDGSGGGGFLAAIARRAGQLVSTATATATGLAVVTSQQQQQKTVPMPVLRMTLMKTAPLGAASADAIEAAGGPELPLPGLFAGDYGEHYSPHRVEVMAIHHHDDMLHGSVGHYWDGLSVEELGRLDQCVASQSRRVDAFDHHIRHLGRLGHATNHHTSTAAAEAEGEGEGEGAPAVQVQVAVQRQELHAQRKLESGKVRRA